MNYKTNLYYGTIILNKYYIIIAIVKYYLKKYIRVRKIMFEYDFVHSEYVCV